MSQQKKTNEINLVLNWFLLPILLSALCGYYAVKSSGTVQFVFLDTSYSFYFQNILFILILFFLGVGIFYTYAHSKKMIFFKKFGKIHLMVSFNSLLITIVFWEFSGHLASMFTTPTFILILAIFIGFQFIFLFLAILKSIPFLNQTENNDILDA